MEEKDDNTKSLEMRVAELEDKLSKLHITEEELRAYHKVAALTGRGLAPAMQAAAPGGLQPNAGCILDCVGGCINECTIRPCTVARNCTIVRFCTVIRACIAECFECFECGGGFPGGGNFGGGFGSLGG